MRRHVVVVGMMVMTRLMVMMRRDLCLCQSGGDSEKSGNR
jgi:hypothetical protein